jgi:hypothetical protein
MLPRVPVAGELERREPHAGEDQDDADDRVLGALDRRAELEADRDDDRAEQQRDQDMRDAGQERESRHPPERVVPGPAYDG